MFTSYISKVVSVVRHGAYDTSTVDGRASERVRRIVLTAFTSTLSRVIGTLLPFLTLRMSIAYLGKDIYGLWMAVNSFFALFAFADFGLGSGLQTTLSRAHGRGNADSCRSLVSSAFYVLTTVSIVCLGVFVAAYPFVSWPKCVNALGTEAIAMSGFVVMAVFVPRVLQLPFSLVQRVQLALQEGYVTELWQIGASVVSTVVLCLIIWCDAGKETLVVAVSVCPAIAFAGNWAWFFWVSQPGLRPNAKGLDKQASVALIGTGGAYCLLSVLTTIGLAVDNLIVAHVCGLSQVATFSVVSRVVGVISMALGMICTPMWSANGEALARGDVQWVRRTTRLIVGVTATMGLIGGVAIVLLGPSLFRFWLGESFGVSRMLLAGFAGREILFCILSPYFMVLNGAGRVWVQIRVFVVYTTVSVILKVVLAGVFGAVVVPWVMSVCYGAIVLPAVVGAARRVLVAKAEQ